jgi:hypothetical protein
MNWTPTIEGPMVEPDPHVTSRAKDGVLGEKVNFPPVLVYKVFIIKNKEKRG